jgi:hypothetical protein
MFTGSCWKPCNANKEVYFSAMLIHAITCLSGRRRFKTLHLSDIQLAVNSITYVRTFSNVFKGVFVERHALCVEHTHTHIHTHIPTPLHIYTQTHIHTYTHTHIHTLKQ